MTEVRMSLFHFKLRAPHCFKCLLRKRKRDKDGFLGSSGSGLSLSLHPCRLHSRQNDLDSHLDSCTLIQVGPVAPVVFCLLYPSPVFLLVCLSLTFSLINFILCKSRFRFIAK